MLQLFDIEASVENSIRTNLENSIELNKEWYDNRHEEAIPKYTFLWSKKKKKRGEELLC